MADRVLRIRYQNFGVFLVVLSTFGWSLSGIFTTAIEGDVWAILFWRSIASGSLVFAYSMWRRRGKVSVIAQRFGWQGWMFCTVCSLSALCFITAFKASSVANVAAIYATAPIFAAWFGWMFLREKIGGKILLVSLVSFAGTITIFSYSIETGKYYGDFLALIMTGCEAVLILLTRKYPNSPLIAAGAVSSLLLASLGYHLSDQIVLSQDDIFLGLLFGFSHAFAIITLIEGARLIPVVSTALISGLEIPIATLFAWFFLAQIPDQTTILGGGIILGALLLHISSMNNPLMRRRKIAKENI